jgi:hypothetical protein
VSKRNILLQLDTDPHASVFDRVVAVDAGVDEIFAYGDVASDAVEGLVHGAIFTRGPQELKHTAIFIGGRNVQKAEELLHAAVKTFFGPLRCSVLLDASGCNTTAAAAVLAAGRHLDLSKTKALVLGGTGPVGQRVALLLAKQKAAVWLGSRTRDRAADGCNAIKDKIDGARIFPAAMNDPESVARNPERFNLVIAAGAAGARLVTREGLKDHKDLRVLIDLNAVPPSGIEGVEPTDFGRELEGVSQYGALGVGRIKMKVHRAALVELYQSNDKVMDAEEVYDLALRMTEINK